jgi:hypothetical protein
MTIGMGRNFFHVNFLKNNNKAKAINSPTRPVTEKV